MPEYLAPGVYMEEIEMGGKPIEGISTSTLGLLGETERGPVTPRLVTNFMEFRRLYGGYVPYSFVANSIEGFFSNGGTRCFMARVVGAGSMYAKLSVSGGGGAAGATLPLKSKDAAPAPDSTTLPPKGKDAVPTPKTTKSGSDVFMVGAVGPGKWGNRVGFKISPSGLSAVDPTLFKITIAYWKESPPEPVVDPTDPSNDKDQNRREPDILEVYDDLSPDPTSSNNYEKRINDISVLVEITRLAGGRPQDMPFKLLTEGKDGAAVGLEDYKGPGIEPGSETGLNALKEIDGISIVCAPNENDVNGLTQELVSHCELLKDRFAILQAPQSAGPIGNLLPPVDSKYAAYYFPWIKVIDPVTQINKLIPPGGHIAGIYARSDSERGVHKAPANEVIRGAMGLQFPLSKAKQDILNPKGINCIRVFPGRGIRVWGARTISSDPLWKYLNVRRLFLYLEGSIDRGTQWVVFEPNNEDLWARVKQTITQFLVGVWRTGALMGTTPGEAFFVSCDRSTMTQDDIDNGRLICVIGVAPTKPAEFVIFRIAQWTRTS